jgi:hypothetical protein
MPRQSLKDQSLESGQIYTNVPSDSVDFDEAFNEAKNLFTEIYPNEDFLVRDDSEEQNIEEDL